MGGVSFDASRTGRALSHITLSSGTVGGCVVGAELKTALIVLLKAFRSLRPRGVPEGLLDVPERERSRVMGLTRSLSGLSGFSGRSFSFILCRSFSCCEKRDSRKLRRSQSSWCKCSEPLLSPNADHIGIVAKK